MEDKQLVNKQSNNEPEDLYGYSLYTYEEWKKAKESGNQKRADILLELMRFYT